jgi:hypothetical protein
LNDELDVSSSSRDDSDVDIALSESNRSEDKGEQNNSSSNESSEESDGSPDGYIMNMVLDKEDVDFSSDSLDSGSRLVFYLLLTKLISTDEEGDDIDIFL